MSILWSHGDEVQGGMRKAQVAGPKRGQSAGQSGEGRRAEREAPGEESGISGRLSVESWGGRGKGEIGKA